MSKYNGHPSYEHWNVSLWLFNDETLYQAVRHCCRKAWRTVEEAATMLMEYLPAKTGDGVDYTVYLVAYAIGDEWKEINEEEEEDDSRCRYCGCSCDESLVCDDCEA